MADTIIEVLVEGAQGPVGAFSSVTVETLAAGEDATASVTGTVPSQVLALGIPRGPVDSSYADAAVAAEASARLAGDNALNAAKAPKESPTFTGTPAAPTASPGTNTTQIATTAFVQAAVDALVGGAPGALDTLNELAAALGDDAAFSTAVTTALANRVRADAAQSFTTGEKAQARANIEAKIVRTDKATLTNYGASGATLAYDNTVPQRSELTDVLAKAFTPKFATSTLRIRGVVTGYLAAQGTTAIAVFLDGAAGALAARLESLPAGFFRTLTVEIDVPSGSTNARTYVVGVGGNQIVYINGDDGGAKMGGALISTLTIDEIEG